MRVGSWALPVLVFVGAAVLEVVGDATIRAGLQVRSGGRIALGAGLLGIYGLVVNLVPWNFARLLGSYVAVFAVVAVLFGWWRFGETIAPATWFGLALIILGGAVIQLGSG